MATTRVSFKQKVQQLLEKRGLSDLQHELGLIKKTRAFKLTGWQKKMLEKRLQSGQVVAMQLVSSGVKLIHPKFITIAPRFRYENPANVKADLAKRDLKKV